MPSSQPLIWGELTLNRETQRVTYHGRSITLTPTESRLLELFLQQPSQVQSYRAIAKHLWSLDDFAADAPIAMQLKQLHHRLAIIGVPEVISAVYGIGYRLEDLPTNAGVGEPSPMLELLWRNHAPQIHDRLTQLETASTALAQQQLTPTQAAAAQALAHKLAGSLGVFGLQQAYGWAQQLERHWQDWQQTQQTSPDAIAQLLKQLQTTVGTLSHTYGVEVEPLAPSPTAAAKPPNHGTVLLVDSDGLLTTRLQAQAKQWHFQLYSAPDSEAAEVMLQRHEPDIVLLDLAISGEPNGGFTLLKSLQKRYPRLPIVVFSAEDDLTVRAAVAAYPPEVMTASHSVFLSKSATPAEVFDAIATILQPKQIPQSQILMVDDDPLILDHLQLLFSQWGFTATPLHDSRHFWKTLEATNPDLLILDLQMPHFDGIQLCKVVRQDPHWQGLPILFLSSACDRDTIRQIYQSGADDYIAKPVHDAELSTRVFNRLERIQLLRSCDETDFLTGLMNRRWASQAMQRYFRLAQRYQHPLSVALVNINGFQQINNRYGQRISDRLLHQLGELLQQNFEPEDVISRWGGDEFMVGLYGLTKSQALVKMNYLLAAVRQTPFLGFDKVEIYLTLRVGIATYPDDGEDVPSLYQQADLALYRQRVEA
jgi:diguanylate cyclase (GGDEF)-like protein